MSNKLKIKAIKSILKFLLKLIRTLLIVAGILFTILIICAFTSLPYWLRYNLGTRNSTYSFTPQYILMLGGSGMPSEENLIRLYYTAQLANKYTDAKIIIAHPKDSAVNASLFHELVIHGIDSSKIFFEGKGTNTRSQVTNTALSYPLVRKSNLLIVTSPEHMYRAIKTFKKAGFNVIGGCSTLEVDMTVDLNFNCKKLGGKHYIPDVGQNIGLRYNFWNYLKLEIICLREYSAIVYYKLNGWI